MSCCYGVFKCCSKRVEDDRDRPPKPIKRNREEDLLKMGQFGMEDGNGDGIYQEDPELVSGSQGAGYKNRDQNMDSETNITVAIDDFMRSPVAAVRTKPSDSQISQVSAN